MWGRSRLGPLVGLLLATGCGFDAGGLPQVAPALPSTEPPPADRAADAGLPAVAFDGGAVTSPPPGSPDGGAGDAASGDAAALPGPVLLLRFDDPAGTVHPRDDSGHGNQGTLHDLDERRAWVRGHRDGALDLGAGGRDGYLRFPSSASLNQIVPGLTIAVWLRRPPCSDPGVIVARAASAGGVIYRLALQHSHLRAQLTGGLDLTSPELLPADRWVHIAFTYDGTRARLYLDGDQVMSAVHGAALFADDTEVVVGAGQPSAQHDQMRDFLPDKLDDLVLYPRALSAEEIGRLRRSGPSH